MPNSEPSSAAVSAAPVPPTTWTRLRSRPVLGGVSLISVLEIGYTWTLPLPMTSQSGVSGRFVVRICTNIRGPRAGGQRVRGLDHPNVVVGRDRAAPESSGLVSLRRGLSDFARA